MLSRFIWRRARTSHGAWTGLIASGCATLTGVAAASGCASYSAEQPAVFDELMELVPTGNGWEWRARPQGKAPPREIKPTTSAPAATASTLAPVVTEPVQVINSDRLVLTEFFGAVGSKEGTASFALGNVLGAIHPWEAPFQTPSFAEYVVVHSGSLDLHTVHKDGCQFTKTHVEAGQGAYLPAGLRVKWTWPEACSYTVVCVPAFSPITARTEPLDIADAALGQSARARLMELHRTAGLDATAPRHLPKMVLGELPHGITPLVVSPVAVVDAPGITILEHFG